MLDLHRLKVLREVALRGSMSAAAEALGYTPSAVSQQIAALEREASAMLVERGTHRIALTEAGRILVEETRWILEQLDLADEEVKAIAGLRGGRLRIATFRSAGETIVARAMMDFHRKWPNVELTLMLGEPEEYLGRLARGEFDLALSFAYDGVPVAPPVAENLVSEPLLAEEMMIALPERHRLATATSAALADLANEPWIASTARSSVHAFTTVACRWEGFEPRIAFETDDYHIMQALVAANVGVSFVPALSRETAHPRVRLLPVRPRPPMRRLHLIIRDGGLVSPCVSEMAGLLRTATCGLRDQGP
ncbi:LysR family transcriptional regulator [Actinomadura sp. NPDC048955]|uniref:LysR family transcriptional regulator n=1 Tax=Actinomadura sp. NPDC048955 TaxID=3158228 RepID=UPI003408EE78